MQLDFRFHRPNPSSVPEFFEVGGRRLQVLFVPCRRAKRYILRLTKANVARVTIPRGGSRAEAWRFAQRHASWLQDQVAKRTAAVSEARAWTLGTETLLAGEPVRLSAVCHAGTNLLKLGRELIPCNDLTGDLRPVVERHLRSCANQILPVRVAELAAQHQFRYSRVSVRNQKSRWGSCSRNGVVCLNWRLIQAPERVKDYVITHELTHLKEMNHSRRFWANVRKICPEFEAARLWLRRHGSLLF